MRASDLGPSENQARKHNPLKARMSENVESRLRETTRVLYIRPTDGSRIHAMST